MNISTPLTQTVYAPRNNDERRRFEGIRLVFEDSILPIEEAGQLTLWDDRFDLDGVPLSMEPAPTHLS